MGMSSIGIKKDILHIIAYELMGGSLCYPSLLT